MNRRPAPIQSRFELGCPIIPGAAGDVVGLLHGDGGRHSRKLIRDRIVSRLGSAQEAEKLGADLGDAAALPRPDGPIAFTTDSFVVTPLFFPGGNIGQLAVYGTVNDLVVSGALPRWLSLALILEEGLPLEVLDRVIDGVVEGARVAGVEIVTGDTKVVPRGTADQLFINTAGIGDLLEPSPPGPSGICPGDVLLVSGPIGRHGLAILAAREDLGLEPPPTSDCAPLTELLTAFLAAGIVPRALRDATRGGVAAVCHEWAEQCGHRLLIDEEAIPTTPEVRGACELLGLDPLFLANEGTLLAAVAPGDAATALAALHGTSLGRNAVQLGLVLVRGGAPVTVRGRLGRERALDEPTHALLPRIC